MVTVDDATVALRLLADRRDELGVRKTQIVNRIHRLLGELSSGGAKRFLTAAQAKAFLEDLHPAVSTAGPAAAMRVHLAAELVEELAGIQSKIKDANRQLHQLVVDSGSQLLGLYGLGPSSAARLLGDVGDIARFPSKNHFASWNGTAPSDASSGDTEHHRLSRAGNRRLNRVLHTMAIVQLRRPDTAGRVFFDRKRAEGKSSVEALRALKRRLSDVVYRRMLADANDRARACSPDAEPGREHLVEPEVPLVLEAGPVTVDDPAPPTLELSAADDPAPAAQEGLVTGPGGHVGAATESSATDCNPGVGSSDKPLPGPAAPSIPAPPSARKSRP